MPEFNKRQVLLRKIAMFVKDLTTLKKRVEKLEQS
jgi:hypothetical protein